MGLRSGGNGTVSLSGGSLNLGNNTGFYVGRDFGSTGLVQQTGGSVTGLANTAGIFSIGDQPGSNGTYNLQAGSLAQNGAAYIGNGGKNCRRVR